MYKHVYILAYLLYLVRGNLFSRNKNKKDAFQRLEDQRIDEPIDD